MQSEFSFKYNTFCQRRKTEEEEAQTDEEVFLSTAFNNKLLFEHTLCRPVCRLSIVQRKTVEQKKHQDKPEVPQGEPRTGPKQDQLTVAQCNEQFEKRYACGEIYMYFNMLYGVVHYKVITSVLCCAHFERV